MKKANKRFRREMMAAERQAGANKRNYPLGNNARIDDEDDGKIMLYEGGGVTIACSVNLFFPEELEALRRY